MSAVIGRDDERRQQGPRRGQCWPYHRLEEERRLQKGQYSDPSHQGHCGQRRNDERRQQDRHDDRDYWRRQQDRRDDERRQQDWHDDERRRQDQQREEEQNDQQFLEIIMGKRPKALSRPQALSRPRHRHQEWALKYGERRFAPPIRR